MFHAVINEVRTQNNLRRAGVTALSAVAGFFAAQLFENPWLVAFCFATMLFVLFHEARVRGVPAQVVPLAAFVLTMSAVSYAWIFAALSRGSALGFSLGIAVYGVLVLLLSIMRCAAIFLSLWLHARGRPVLAACGLALTYPLAERGTAEFLGFAWLSIGDSQLDSPLGVFLPLLGSSGIGAVLLLCCAGAAQLLDRLREKPRPHPALFAAVLLPWVIGLALRDSELQRFTAQTGDELRVRLLQPAQSIAEKTNASRVVTNIDAFAAQVREARADLVITPETSLPAVWTRLPRDVRQRLVSAVSDTGSTLVLGTFDLVDTDIANVSLALNARNVESIYLKRRLVPLGERSPPGFGWLTDLLALPYDTRVAAASSPTLFTVDGLIIRPSICLELGFPGDFSDAAAAVNLIVNQSNLEWFPGDAVRTQFLRIARARAMEQQKPVLLAGNDGPTALIGPDGRTRAVMSGFGAGHLDVRVRGSRGATPFALLGDAIWLSPLVLALLWFAVRKRS